jgi:hypothetical protein
MTIPNHVDFPLHKNMRKMQMAYRGVLTILALTFSAHAVAQPTIKRFEWGVETWEIGTSEFPIEFKEKSPVKILDIEGNLTAGPQPNFEPSEKMIRQTLATLVDVGDVADPMDVVVSATPPERANHVVSPHLFSVNVKQTNSETENIPISYHYGDAPVQLHQNKLMFHIFNESYRHNKKLGSFVSKDQKDALNVEIHLTITYQVDEPEVKTSRAKVDTNFLKRVRAWTAN